MDPKENLERLRRYQLMEPLGQGGTGRTFRGIDRRTNREVAVKVLSLKGALDWKAFDLFEREVAVLGRLKHPAIPAYLDSYASEKSGDFFLVMDLVEGDPLSKIIDGDRRTSPAELRDFLGQAFDVLEYLHGLSPPVVHRDIKPANLVVDRKGRLHLVDFGGVRQIGRVGGSSTMIGTFGYMAPEQLHGSASPASDIYALGATLASLHAGADADTLPHEGLRLDVDALALPVDLRAVVRRMVEPEPKGRFQTVAEVRAALRTAPASGTKAPSPSDALVARSQASPATISPAARLLAKVPMPLSVLVWIATAFGSGMLVVFEFLLRRVLPPLLRDRHQKPLRELTGDVHNARTQLSWVADRTHPLHDDDPAHERKPPRK